LDRLESATLVRSSASSIRRRFSTSAEPGGHNIRSYGYYTAAGFVTLVLVHAYFLFQPHDHQLRQEYTHMHQMRKPFPFRDGKTPLFGLSDGEEH